MAYPAMDNFNADIRKTAANHNIDLIDNESIFQIQPAKEALFVADGHCNTQGYRLIATNIYNALLKAGVLSKNIAIGKTNQNNRR